MLMDNHRDERRGEFTGESWRPYKGPQLALSPLSRRLQGSTVSGHIDDTIFMAKCTVRKNWILGGYSAEYTHTIGVQASRFSDLVNELLRALHDQLLSDEGTGTLRDVKGRNRRDTLLTGIPGHVEDELFRVGGAIATDERGDDFDWSPFDVSCHTSFNAFEGTHHIRYNTAIRRTDQVPPWLPWRLLGAAAPIRLSYCRIGLERFRSKFTLSSIGFLPQVTDSFLLDATEGTVSLKIATEQTTWKAANPIEEIPLFSSIDRALRSSLNVNLATSFYEELVRAGSFRTK